MPPERKPWLPGQTVYAATVTSKSLNGSTCACSYCFELRKMKIVLLTAFVLLALSVAEVRARWSLLYVYGLKYRAEQVKMVAQCVYCPHKVPFSRLSLLLHIALESIVILTGNQCMRHEECLRVGCIDFYRHMAWADLQQLAH